MKLQDLLKKHFGDDEAKLNSLLEEMKSNSIFTASEENLDTRYGKLKGKHDALELEHAESLKLIEQLKQSNANNEVISQQLAQYEAKVRELEEQNKQLAIESDLKLELLSSGAKASDIDYLIYRAKQNEAEFKLDENGNVKGLVEVIEGLKKNYSSNFENGSRKEVDVKELPNDEKQGKSMTKEDFLKKPYKERVQFAESNPEAFNEMMNK